jgi:hypothetical protein
MMFLIGSKVYQTMDLVMHRERETLILGIPRLISRVFTQRNTARYSELRGRLYFDP